MFTTHQAWGEADCDKQKKSVLIKCRKTVELGTDYVRPNRKCCDAVKTSDMVCICLALSLDDEYHVSAVKLVDAAEECGNPVPAENKCGSKNLVLFVLFFPKRNSVVLLCS
ncbi:hypothetical protein HU200_027630 [Digitaria exilis]|uniref:Bifunctional inhibitor/plant lipid transfer protein/seed storage helical domain-containing protein n=1 Tax=Digitaria exilis TaxID=1010633 RepID=A0A835BXW9_9POAL|nr:hypothetical protein HU200_027630 [Digitaria exilis]